MFEKNFGATLPSSPIGWKMVLECVTNEWRTSREIAREARRSLPFTVRCLRALAESSAIEERSQSGSQGYLYRKKFQSES